MTTPGKSLLNQRPVVHYFGYFIMRTPLILSLCVVAVPSGYQQKLVSVLSPAISSQAQLERSSSVAAGMYYLKNKCNRSDLLAGETTYRTAANVGKARGWGNTDMATLSQNSDRLYQQLLQNSTLEATQCSQFNRQLAPLIVSLRSG